jgi:sporulation protein YlmC with PRC-barrel domain
MSRLRVRHLGLDLLDRQLVDRDGVLCGKVDDVELERAADGGLTVTALLVGPGAWPERLPAPLRGAARRLFGERAARVPWRDVREVDSAVRLSRKAAELRPQSVGDGLRLSWLLGRRLSRQPGGRPARIRDVEVSPRGADLRVVAVLTGGRGLLARLGLPVGRRAQERLAWERVAEETAGPVRMS